MEIEKMKVAELRAELSARGLDVRGTKPILMVRLREAIDKEAEEKEQKEEEEEEEEAETLTTEKAVVEPVEEEKPMEQDDAKKKEEEEAKVEEEEKQESKAEETAKVEESKDDEKSVAGGSKQEEEPMKVDEAKADSEAAKVESDQKADDANKDEKSGESSSKDKTADEVKTDKKEEESKEKSEANKAKKEESAAKSAPNAQSAEARRGQKRRVDDSYIVTEDEPEMSATQVQLDCFNSDLSLKIERPDLLKAHVFSSRDAWAYAWAGVRATFGFAQGKIMFEVKILEETEVKLPGESKEEVVNELRVGWSTNDSPLTLGESQHSFCYAGSGKKGHDSKFEAYFDKFGKGDVVTALLDLDDDHVVFSFAKNGKLHNEAAFEIAKGDLEGKPLFPHISTRNTKFEANFGGCSDDGPTFLATYDDEASEALEHYKFPDQVPLENRVRSSERNAKRDECEVIMLVGLPGAGKTTWVNKYVKDHPEKRFNVIGTAPLIDRMKIDGKHRKEAMPNGQWEGVFQKCARSLLEMIKTAATRRRNFIIDQPNVYGPGHRRKIRQFDGMKKKVVFIVPSDEEYKKRLEAQQKDASREIPDNAIMEMKANFVIPSEDDDNPFDELIFTELDRKAASELAETYRKDAQSKGFGKRYDPKNKKQRGFPSKGGRGAGSTRGSGRFVNNANNNSNNNRGRMAGRFNSGFRGGSGRGGLTQTSGRFGGRVGGPAPWGQSQPFGRGGQSFGGTRNFPNRGGSSGPNPANQARGGRGSQAKYPRNEPRWQQGNAAPWSNSGNESWNQRGSGGRWYQPGGGQGGRRGFGGFDGPSNYDDGMERGGPMNPWGHGGGGMGPPPFGGMGGGPDNHYGRFAGPWGGSGGGGYGGPPGGPSRGYGGQGGFFDGQGGQGGFGGGFGRQGVQAPPPRWGFNRH